MFIHNLTIMITTMTMLTATRSSVRPQAASGTS